MFKLPASERLVRWREFRKSLDAMPFEQALESVASFWRHCPFSPYYLDPDKPEHWPDPWTMVEENWYCDIAKALGMLYTVKFTVHNPDVELRVYIDPETKYTYNLVWIEQGKYVLNLDIDDVVNKEHVEKHLTLKRKYKEELNLSNY
jgi:hypothetical protein